MWEQEQESTSNGVTHKGAELERDARNSRIQLYQQKCEQSQQQNVIQTWVLTKLWQRLNFLNTMEDGLWPQKKNLGICTTIFRFFISVRLERLRNRAHVSCLA